MPRVIQSIASMEVGPTISVSGKRFIGTRARVRKAGIKENDGVY